MKNALRRRTLLKAASATAIVTQAVHAAPDPDGYPRVMQGPMLGWTSADTATIWIRVSGAFETAIEYAPTDRPDNWLRTQSLTTQREKDFTVVHTISGLQANQSVFYRILVNGEVDPEVLGRPPHVLRTAPGRASTFRIAFGSCARVQRHPVQPVWDALSAYKPDLFLWLGDNIYGDSLEPAILAEEYRRQRDVTNLKALMSSVPQLAIWDDHDFGLNDHDKTNPIRDQALNVFKTYWANPSYGLPDVPGVFFKYSYGGVDFFFLDNRYHRDAVDQPDDDRKTTLGMAQREWLLAGLRKSVAPFKLVLCGQPWNDGKPPGAESWSSFSTERQAILDFVRRGKIGGVVLVSGDTHVGELNILPHERYNAGYDIFEFVSSPLAQDTAQSWIDYRPVHRARQVYARGSNAGVIEFDMTASDPALRFNLIDVQGLPVWSPLELRASDLLPGARTWRAKMDKLSLQRWERHEKGLPYYGSQR